MPLTEEATLIRDLLRPAQSTDKPVARRAGGPPAGPAQDQLHGPPPGEDSIADLLGCELSLHEILSRRRSVRSFSVQAARASELAMAADAGLTAVRRLWPVPALGMRLILVLAALNVAGLAPGLYRATAEAPDGFSLLERDPAWMQELRIRFADAPALLIVCGDVGSACRSMGKDGYRQALVLAAAAGHAAWLRAVSLGLAGTVFGGTCHHVTASLAEAGFAHHWHLFTLALGKPERYEQEHSRDD